MTAQTANYIYIQLAKEIHNDEPRILTSSDDFNLTLYISDFSDKENIILNNFIYLINKKLNETQQN